VSNVRWTQDAASLRESARLTTPASPCHDPPVRACAIAATLVLALSACFSDPPPVDEDSTTGTSCPVGALQCACTPGGSCDAPYVCHAPSSTCIEDACDPGTEFCMCSDGACFPGFECIDELCVPPSGTTGVVPDTDDATTMVGATDPTATSQDTTAGEVGSEDATGTTGATGLCEMCLEQSAIFECSASYGSCLGDDVCTPFAACVFEHDSVAVCCMMGLAPSEAWVAFVGCATNPDFAQCPDECRGVQLTC